MECLCIRVSLLVPSTRYEFEVNAVPVNLIQNHSQQNDDNGNRTAGEQELLTTEQGTAYNIK